MYAPSNQPGEVCHVNQIEGANLVGDLAHTGKINNPRICAASSDDQLRFFLFRQLFEIVIINGLALFGDAVRDDSISFAGKIQMVSVGKVSAVGQIQSKDGIAGLQYGRICFHIRLRSGVGLHVCVFRSKEFLGSFARQIFHHIGKFTTSVVALARITLGILVGEDGAHGFQNRFADEVF